jgi:histidine ammonia-lyase
MESTGDRMNDKVLDRIHKLGPVVVTVLAVLALASAWGASQWQLTVLARAQDAIAADQKAMAADIRTIREGLAALQVAARFNEERITELRGRVRDLERR